MIKTNPAFLGDRQDTVALEAEGMARPCARRYSQNYATGQGAE